MRRERRFERRVQVGCAAIVLVAASCASVTPATSLQSEPGRSWIDETTGKPIVVASTGGVATSGRLLGSDGEVVQLQGTDGTRIAIPVAPGTNLREVQRGQGALVGGLAGAGIGSLVGAILAASLGSPNPDSAGGVEHPPAIVVIPLSALVGGVVGALLGLAAGAERRLVIDSAPPPAK